jgi:hypothetical protein
MQPSTRLPHSANPVPQPPCCALPNNLAAKQILFRSYDEQLSLSDCVCFGVKHETTSRVCGNAALTAVAVEVSHLQRPFHPASLAILMHMQTQGEQVCIRERCACARRH